MDSRNSHQSSVNLTHLKLISKMDYLDSRNNNKARASIDENPNPIREIEIKFQNPIIFRLRHFDAVESFALPISIDINPEALI